MNDLPLALDQTLTVCPMPGGRGGPPNQPPSQPYLLVLQTRQPDEGGQEELRHSVARFPLPLSGEVLIGRTPEANLQLHDDKSTSKKHAKIVSSLSEVKIIDQGSHNGTRVNGEAITGARVLVSGDVISIGETTLVFHRTARLSDTRPIGNAGQLRQRLEEEIERGLHYHRSLGLLCLDLGDEKCNRLEITAALGGRLRRIDFAAWQGGAQLLVLLPDLNDIESVEVGEQLVAALANVAPVRVGVACCPTDACDVDNLLSVASRAAKRAGAGEVRLAAEALPVKKLIDGQEIILANPMMFSLYEKVAQLASKRLSVVIMGENGVGKEHVARALHFWSTRREAPFMAINCAAMPENLLESELFGHEKGAFTGAVATKKGRLELADGGTFFLDEVGEMSASMQAKLLRTLETRMVTHVGGGKEIPVDIRLVAATNRDLAEEVKTGRYRQDLYYRLGASLYVPPLRDRKDELPLLARAMLERECTQQGRSAVLLTDSILQRMLAYGWPGNVRELKNAMEYLAATVDGTYAEERHLEERILGRPRQPSVETRSIAPNADGMSTLRPIKEELAELERRRMVEALEAAGGVQVRAAKLIDMPERTFFKKVVEYQITPRRLAARSKSE